MDLSNALELIMNQDSDISDMEQESGDESAYIPDVVIREERAEQEMEMLHAMGINEEEEEETTINIPTTTTNVPTPTTNLQARRMQYNWQPATRSPPAQSFKGKQGATAEVVVSNEENPLEYFQLIFTDALLDWLVTETNRYAYQYWASKVDTGSLGPESRCQAWKNTDKNELKVFLGLVILTGLVSKPTIESFWSTEGLTETPFFGKCMSRNRFQLLTSVLHFNDNSSMHENNDDKLYKIRPVYDMMLSRWRSLYTLGEHISIDEGMMKWRGRLSFRVYNKDKPIKYGIKSYILADSTSYYCWNLDMYHGVRKPLRETVCGLLTPSCSYLWHSLYMDNFYNSVELSEALLAQEIHTVGTLRSYRGEPPEVRAPRNLQHNSVVAVDNGKVMVLAWKDKRIVKAISTKHDATLCPVQRRIRGAHGEREVVIKPACIVDYNNYMSGVDHLDQMIAYYPCTRKSLKWTKKVFFYLMEISIHNSFVLYQEKSREGAMSFKTFKLELVRKLCARPPVDQQGSSSSGGAVKRPSTLERLNGGFMKHHLEQLPPTQKVKYPTRSCRVCQKNKIRRETRYCCKECEVTLCATLCFHKFHLLEDY